MSDDNQTEEREQRHSERLKVFEIAGITGPSGAVAGVIADLSATGTLIATDVEFKLGEKVTFELEETGSIPAEVVHIRKNLMGLKFLMDEDTRVKFITWLTTVKQEDR